MIRLRSGMRLIALVGLSMTGLTGCFEGKISDGQEEILSDRPFAYVVRDYPEMGETATINIRPPLDPRAPYAFEPGARLMVRDRIALNSGEHHALAGYFGGAYDVKDLDVSPDGERMVFAAHGPAGSQTNFTWNIFEYTFATGKVRRIFKDDLVANSGHDTNPTYTNEGRIVFSSSRQHSRGDWQTLDLREYLEDFKEPASLLHSVKPDGSELVQITFGEFHDIEPSTMNDGHVVFIRFGRLYETLTDCTLDNIDDPNFNQHPHGGGYGQGNGNGFPPGLEDPKDWTEDDKCGASLAGETEDERVFVEDVLSLYRITPAGGNVHRYFGSLSEEFSDASFIHYMDPIPLDDGNLLTTMRHIYNPVYGGDVVKINSKLFFAVDQPVDESVIGEAEESMTPGLVNFYPRQVSPNGWYSAVGPYNDGSGRLLASWAQCLTSDGDTSLPCEGSATTQDLGDPQYGIWMVDPQQNTRLPVVRGHERALYTDIAIADANELAKPYTGERHDLQLEDNTALFEIRSIYDMDGADMAALYDGGIETRRDPGQTRPDDRSERFIRVVGTRQIPPELEQSILTNEILNPAEGPLPPLGLTPLVGSGNRTLYDVLSYAMVEPDGSALVKVPADTNFSFEVVNKYGKRVDLIARPDYNYNYLMQHPQPLRLEEGEKLKCYGCHDPEVDIPHARTDVELASANPGAPGDGMPFPNANPKIRAVAWKDTMAQALVDSLRELQATWADRVSYEDFWSNPPDPLLAFEVRYDGLNTPAPVTDPGCLTNWTADCKATINYQEHIQPIWDACRVDPNRNVVTSCQNCHRAAEGKSCPDGVGGGGASTNLLLGSGNASWDGRRLESYVELFEPDYYIRETASGEWVEVDKTNLEAECPEGIQGDMTVLPDPGVCFSRRLMSARGAIASARFFSLFDSDPDDDEYEVETAETAEIRQSHKGMLTQAELRLIAEWLDAGAHLFNDPDKFELPAQ
ncbi:PD40 domain-containing protein [Marinobacter daepoensis]|uniref:PD40 domain-containing protein n=1 Tax=Marinobacter daepoensis TaxID=262077 RepID=UPI0003FDCB97|nr:PD40 domain-containing protein [Marinobacter daepoensis]